jgi:hypothetical protein
MLLGLEIALTVFGIITITKGRIALSSGKVVTGAPAYVIGAILAATFPLIILVAFCYGVYLGAEAAMHGGPRPTVSDFIWVDVGGVVIVPLIALIIALATAKPPSHDTLIDDEDVIELPPESIQ